MDSLRALSALRRSRNSYESSRHAEESAGSIAHDADAEHLHATEQAVLQLLARASSYNPLARDQEHTKALDLLVPILGTSRARALIDTVWRIDKVADVRELRTSIVWTSAKAKRRCVERAWSRSSQAPDRSSPACVSDR